MCSYSANGRYEYVSVSGGSISRFKGRYKLVGRELAEFNETPVAYTSISMVEMADDASTLTLHHVAADDSTSMGPRTTYRRISEAEYDRILREYDMIAPAGPASDPSPSSDITADFDPLFAQELEERGYIADADKITFAEVKGITELDVAGEWNEEAVGYDGELTSLKGIEYFESLTILICYHNQLKALDISKNTALIGISCGNNLLTTLDISNNIALEFLYCEDNQLAVLDVSKHTALTDLGCYRNRLTTLDVSKNTALKYLECQGNPGNGTVFPVTAWFDNNSIPSCHIFTTGSWKYNGSTITITYRKAR